MTEEEVLLWEQKLKAMGIDPVKFVFAMLMQSTYIDLAHSWHFEIEDIVKPSDAFKGRIKQTIKNIKDQLELLQSDLRHRLGMSAPTEEIKEQTRINFGERSDFINDCCQLLVKVSPQERIKVISTLKLFVRE